MSFAHCTPSHRDSDVSAGYAQITASASSKQGKCTRDSVRDSRCGNDERRLLRVSLGVSSHAISSRCRVFTPTKAGSCRISAFEMGDRRLTRPLLQVPRIRTCRTWRWMVHQGDRNSCRKAFPPSLKSHTSPMVISTPARRWYRAVGSHDLQTRPQTPSDFRSWWR